MSFYRRTAGFTLIEIMITVAILGIVAAIAFPTYREHVFKVRRGDAQGALMGLASALEKYHVDNRTFNGADPAVIYTDTSPVDGSQVYYELTISAADARTFEIRAVPKNSQAPDKCGTLTLTRSGRRGVVDGSLPVAECWRS